jgi:lipopolysaccharide transport system ATP-binding protein
VSFEVQPGEVVGIIGRNGAGKSTLLKILSRITEPTGGQAMVFGRVSSMLEVGTGFHPELTGRENIYMSGTILGMTSAEIDRKFDEIVAFSGVEQFLDTPVKRFSSGMQVRLAFSVAAYLEPEILLVDEVLAVGDAEFQKKCLGTMHDATRQGRTVLFVSHNMAAIRNLCPRTLLIDHGTVALDATTEIALAQYLEPERDSGGILEGAELEHRITRRGWDKPGKPTLRCVAVRLSGPDQRPRTGFQSDEPITLSITYECLASHCDLRLVVSVVDDDNVPILVTQNADAAESRLFYHPAPGLYRSTTVFPPNLFGEKRFYISLRLVFPHIDQLDFDKVLSFDVRFAGYNNIQYLSHKEAFLRPRLWWHTEAVSEESCAHQQLRDAVEA